MPFVIDYEDSDAAAITAPTAREAFDLAKDMVARGRKHVRITSPNGDTHTLTQLASFLRLESAEGD
jgi:hypothetical protein